MIFFNGAEVPNPSEELGVDTCSQSVVAALDAFVPFYAVLEVYGCCGSCVHRCV